MGSSFVKSSVKVTQSIDSSSVHFGSDKEYFTESISASLSRDGQRWVGIRRVCQTPFHCTEEQLDVPTNEAALHKIYKSDDFLDYIENKIQKPNSVDEAIKIFLNRQTRQHRDGASSPLRDPCLASKWDQLTPNVKDHSIVLVAVTDCLQSFFASSSKNQK